MIAVQVLLLATAGEGFVHGAPSRRFDVPRRTVCTAASPGALVSALPSLDVAELQATNALTVTLDVPTLTLTALLLFAAYTTFAMTRLETKVEKLGTKVEENKRQLDTYAQIATGVVAVLLVIWSVLNPLLSSTFNTILPELLKLYQNPKAAASLAAVSDALSSASP
eukprot:CAMPEP_0198648118 /NCGR_PEP_ID=MMETSP1467-20131203/3263_1 /TAXON_ID=1462469 /ORGANISM="unid. sp., Strain CCMP2135" /LENGTH=166 /DNA_ID=CAMNT_0044383813 /DNA_START=35 /DNA_END=535 /DNA_ORIENTATION=+